MEEKNKYFISHQGLGIKLGYRLRNYILHVAITIKIQYKFKYNLYGSTTVLSKYLRGESNKERSKGRASLLYF